MRSKGAQSAAKDTFNEVTNESEEWWTPEKRLMLSVFMDGIRSALGATAGPMGCEGKKGTKRQQRLDQDWVLDEVSDGPTSYRFLCELFEKEPEVVRRRVRALQQRHRVAGGLDR